MAISFVTTLLPSGARDTLARRRWATAQAGAPKMIGNMNTHATIQEIAEKTWMMASQMPANKNQMILRGNVPTIRFSPISLASMSSLPNGKAANLAMRNAA